MVVEYLLLRWPHLVTRPLLNAWELPGFFTLPGSCPRPHSPVPPDLRSPAVPRACLSEELVIKSRMSIPAALRAQPLTQTLNERRKVKGLRGQCRHTQHIHSI